jgi:hypothetical protein
MAKLQEEVLVIKVSRLVRDNEAEPQKSMLLNQPTLESLEAVVQELAGPNTLVEIQVP